MTTLELKVPYPFRHICADLKRAGGRFNGTTKTWTLPETPESRRLAAIISRPLVGQTPEEKQACVLSMAVELLNEIGSRKFFLIENGDRVVIESEPRC